VKPPEPKPPSRSELRNAGARAKLVPLREGERPTAVTVAAVIAATLVVANIALALGGYRIHNQRPALPGVLVFSVLLAAMAWGLWRARYWAVLGMEALLGLLIVIFALLLATASNVQSVAIALAVIVLAGTLFWKLVRGMARIQMPQRPEPRR
jgi:lipoprotein signal peptidase